ncbi:hypothetical protein ACJD0Z_13120 [Flavobacteriaceae bacterium M23B6Z8]
MEQDLRELFRASEEKQRPKLRPGHEDRFEKRLNENFPKSVSNSFFYLKIAAGFLILLTAGYFIVKSLNSGNLKDTPEMVTTKENTPDTETITLGDISPDLKKVEDYYVANIYIELSEIEVTEENKKLFDGYMLKLAELTAEYQNLSEELNEIGPNEQTITALIDNLQFRLQLLKQLKEKLKELKETKDDKFENKQV